MSEDPLEPAFSETLEDILGWDLELSEKDGAHNVESWDSLTQVRLVHELETRFAIRLPDEALLKEQTVGSLRSLVRSHVDGR